jgi:hypothetical protein
MEEQERAELLAKYRAELASIIEEKRRETAAMIDDKTLAELGLYGVHREAFQTLAVVSATSSLALALRIDLVLSSVLALVPEEKQAVLAERLAVLTQEISEQTMKMFDDLDPSQ